LIAPGICPATGSSGSTSPRKRSRARASTSSIEPAARLLATAFRVHLRVDVMRRERGRGDRRHGGTHRSFFARPLRKSTVQHRDGVVSGEVQHPPQARRIHTVALVVGDDLLGGVDAEPPEDRGAGRRVRKRVASVAAGFSRGQVAVEMREPRARNVSEAKLRHAPARRAAPSRGARRR
jgi:hypothetical protein